MAKRRPYYAKDNDGYVVHFDKSAGAKKYVDQVGGSAYRRGQKKPFYSTASSKFK